MIEGEGGGTNFSVTVCGDTIWETKSGQGYLEPAVSYTGEIVYRVVFFESYGDFRFLP